LKNKIKKLINSTIHLINGLYSGYPFCCVWSYTRGNRRAEKGFNYARCPKCIDSGKVSTKERKGTIRFPKRYGIDKTINRFLFIDPSKEK